MRGPSLSRRWLRARPSCYTPLLWRPTPRALCAPWRYALRSHVVEQFHARSGSYLSRPQRLVAPPPVMPLACLETGPRRRIESAYRGRFQRFGPPGFSPVDATRAPESVTPDLELLVCTSDRRKVDQAMGDLPTSTSLRRFCQILNLPTDASVRPAPRTFPIAPLTGREIPGRSRSVAGPHPPFTLQPIYRIRRGLTRDM